jgi:heme/copper-type cytochrome/quinol oxidase subunit 1
MHGVAMVFFFLIPAIPAVLGNFLVPIMIGAKDLAFPRINLLSWYIYMVGGLFTPRRSPAAWTRAGRSTRPTARPRRTRT